MRIRADMGKCQGYGNCVALDDEHFDLDDDGLVVILDDTVTDDRGPAADAVRSCPAGALRLSGDDE